MSRNWNGKKPVVDCSGDKPITVQADRDQVDINRIVSRIEKGLLVSSLGGEPFYGDVSELGGLQDAFIKVREAEELFMSYPAQVREKFDNDPVKFVEFFEDPANTDKAIELGLVQKRPVEPPVAPPAPPAQ